jgi:phage gpG-like protein
VAAVTVEVRGDAEVAARFARLSERGVREVRRAIEQLCVQDEALVKQKLSGEVLNVVTGALRSSIFHEVESTGDTIIGRIASSGDVKYAAIHEFGGTISHPGGTAYIVIAGQGATFISNAVAAGLGTRISGRTAPHTIHMPERSFLRSALREMEPKIRTTLEAAVTRAVSVD